MELCNIILMLNYDRDVIKVDIIRRINISYHNDEIRSQSIIQCLTNTTTQNTIIKIDLNKQYNPKILNFGIPKGSLILNTTTTTNKVNLIYTTQP